MSYYKETRPKCKIEIFSLSGKQENIYCFHVDKKLTIIVITVFSSQDFWKSVFDQDFERAHKETEMDDMRREYIEEKGYRIEKTWRREWWKNFKTKDMIKNYINTYFPYKRLFNTDSFFKKNIK